MDVSSEAVKRYGTLCESVTTEEIRRVLEQAFYDREEVIALYSTRGAFSSLLDWMPAATPWKRALIVLLHRMEAERAACSPLRTVSELQKLLDKSYVSVAECVRQSSPFSYVTLFHDAHRLMGGEQRCIAEGNVFRQLGIDVVTWRYLALGGVRTLSRLLEHTPQDLLNVPGMGRKRVEQVEEALKDKEGLSLKAC